MTGFKEGLYDELVTRQVREFLDLRATQGLNSSVDDVEENDYPDYLAHHCSSSAMTPRQFPPMLLKRVKSLVYQQSVL